MDEQQQLILPFYVVADVSYSMTQNGRDGVTPLDSLNQLVPSVKDALDTNPILCDKVRFSLIDFSDDARTQIPMCDLSQVANDQIPRLVARGATSFAAAFDTSRQQIDTDYRQLKADGHKVHRPAMFFLTDGEPTDDDSVWRQAFADLTDSSFRPHPNVIPFGVAGANKAVLDQLAHPHGKMRSFVTADGADPAQAITKMAELLIGSIVASAGSIGAQGQAGSFVPPDPDEDDDIWL